ncbi:hypothetical protein BMH32_00270 [Leucobacter sp. OLJS4]|nr:hypothetical protein BMH25_12935 [Leucobacter sp. OLCALW19]PII86507.1 hypothetical protein BMH26_13355 [Leucobacter sp. OLTLW20]PII90444.1 hypothetical protein BMH27_11520 [Leucobacter sp. OLAS13]PII97475.1 hypothetical protein BMH29_12205 [Leucobacter sp. OLDS2]PIJ02507.1 hypothetical protein BMH31_12675 [Leucobacter sp. OLIS6]PIJ04966.1 hypothetical protein BMH28_00470 [Leucobacter sp. OLCS4]PIJ15127.1 hypothetical protein BMH32_00270 [Leucobacter sp. OLJS4]PIJ53150.1 hypothetical prote
MLPTPTDNGARLAAILPTGLACLAPALGSTAADALDLAFAGPPGPAEDPGPMPDLPELRSLVLIVVDGLGHANLQERAGHARTILSMPGRRIETVAPSTTGAALTTLTTGRLPGSHGLIGYRIRHPELGLVTTLRDWDGIDPIRSWQRAEPLFGLAGRMGARPLAIGRPAHEGGGLTRAILSHAEYLGGQRIEDRFALASQAVRGPDPVLAYLYIDELDKAGHEQGWGSDAWLARLEQFDAALDGFLRGLPGGVGVVLTADHGMVDVPQHGQLVLDEEPIPGVAQIGGEPRFRSLYLEDGADPEAVAHEVESRLGKLAWVGTRDAAIAGGWFGETAADVVPRLGEVLVAARKQVAFTLRGDDPRALAMVGQHGSLSAEERGIPLRLGGALAGSGFASAVARVAADRVR